AVPVALEPHKQWSGLRRERAGRGDYSTARKGRYVVVSRPGRYGNAGKDKDCGGNSRSQHGGHPSYALVGPRTGAACNYFFGTISILPSRILSARSITRHPASI